MATRWFEWRKSQSVILFANGTKAGSGPEKHMCVGTNNSGDRFRTLVRFQHDFSGVHQLTKATLRLKGTGSSNHISKGGAGTIRIALLNASFSDGGGSEAYWRTDAAEVWPGVDGWGVTVTRSITPANDRDHDLDITDIVDQWLPSSVLQSNGQPGPGKSNYGLMIDDNGGSLKAEFGTGRGSNAPNLFIEYTTETAPTIGFISPTEEGGHNLVALDGLDRAGSRPTGWFDWTETPGPNDVIGSGSARLLASDGTTELDAIAWGTVTLPVEGWHSDYELEPGTTYKLEVSLTGSPSGLSATRTITFVAPYAEATYVLPLGVNPESVGAAVQWADVHDTKVVHWARSTDGLNPDANGWVDTVPTDWPDGQWWLLCRARIARPFGTPDWLPFVPDGLDSIVANWKSA